MSDTEEPQAFPPGIENYEADDTIKIMLATDNHIGYLERDPVRGQDSINTFKEILKLARKHEVDMILLGGDLFHENKPSRDCLYQVMGLLREYTMGTKPVELELLSSPDEGKPTSYNLPGINYEDENLNVAIPVFSIHGNHDDPQGAGPEGALCALDMLSVAGLVNYIGKLDLSLDTTPQGAHEGIAVRPVLLRKGETKLGLYGVGNVKDTRMHFELRSNRVRMYMPRDKASWFNLMVVHQNRVKHGPQEYVPEGLFDDNVDLVVWGHEHDCRIVPEPVAGKRYYISQPGSSVATSLAEGESKEKHVALLEIQGKGFQLTPVPLRTVRPFVMAEAALAEVAEEEGFDVSDQVAIGKFLKTRVNELIAEADAEWSTRNEALLAEGEPELERMLPLVRLKVDTTGVPGMTNPIRFGQEFAGRVANPRDVLVFHRAKQAAARRVAADAPIDMEDDAEMDGEDRKRAVERVRVRALVQDYLRAQELQLLGESGLADAIQKFVDKDDIHAIQTHVQHYLSGLMKGVSVHGEIPEEDLEDVLEKVRSETAKEYNDNYKSGKPAAKGKGKARATESDAESADSMAMDVDLGANGAYDFAEDSEPPPPPPKKTARATTAAKKAPAKKPAARGKKKAVEESEEEIELPPDDDEDEEDEDEPSQPKKRTNRAATLTQIAKKAPAKKAAATKKATPAQSQLAFAPTGARSTRTAAGRSRKKTAEVIDLDDSDE